MITIPAAGAWTFGLDHNEGFLLQIGEDEFEVQRHDGGFSDVHVRRPGRTILDLVPFRAHGQLVLKALRRARHIHEFQQPPRSTWWATRPTAASR